MAFDIRAFAESRQTPAPARDIDAVTDDVLRCKADVSRSLIRIGKLLMEAKGMLHHGEWLDWLHDRVEFSERGAQQAMAVADKYSKPQALADLGATKAFSLLALPDAERESLIDGTTVDVGGAEKSVYDMSTREVQSLVKELNAAKTAEAEAKADAAAAEESRDKMAKDMDLLKSTHAATVQELDDLKSRPVEIAVEKDDEAVKQAREEGRAESRNEIANLKSELKRAEKNAPTNAANIRYMSDQELAVLLVDQHTGSVFYCKSCIACGKDKGKKVFDKQQCIDCMMKWLREVHHG